MAKRKIAKPAAAVNADKMCDTKIGPPNPQASINKKILGKQKKVGTDRQYATIEEI